MRDPNQGESSGEWRSRDLWGATALLGGGVIIIVLAWQLIANGYWDLVLFAGLAWIAGPLMVLIAANAIYRCLRGSSNGSE